MNHMSADAARHRAADVDLSDVWEGTARPPAPVPERLRGITQGYQPYVMYPRRQDKFFYIGMVDAVPPSEVRDLAGKIGRLGRGVKAKVRTWECDIEPVDLVKGNFVLTSGKSYCDTYRRGGARREIKVWVSDYVGITTRIRVR